MPLKIKQVGKYTVSQRGPLQNARIRIFYKRIEKLLHVPLKDEELDDEKLAYNEFLQSWVGFAACTEPLVTLEQYKEDSELDEVMAAVDEVNSTETGEPPRSKKKNAK